MKRIYNFSILSIGFGLMFILGACDTRLDVVPQQSIDEETALNTPKNVFAALVGAYDGLSDNDVWGGGQHLSELLGDDGEQVWAGSFAEPEEIFQKSILVQNLSVLAFWTESYEAINRANNVLSAIDVLDADDQGRVEGEAKFVRAAIYFDLANLFGKPYSAGNTDTNPAIPLVLLPTRAIDASSEVPRASVAQVYEQILADLTFARDNLPETNGIFATTYAASALLSRVHLMMENYNLAGQEAGRVISSGLYALNAQYADCFNQPGNTPEDIFTIEVTSQDGLNDFILFYAAPEAGGRGDIDITGAHLAEYEPGDARRSLFYVDGNGINRTGKWINNASQDGNINIIRLAEMYLTRAESRFRSSDPDGAAQDLKVVRNRVNLPEISSGNLALEDILLERRLELIFEGHLFRDRKRLKASIGSLPFDDNKLIYPIPQREMDVNANLVQNAGY